MPWLTTILNFNPYDWVALPTHVSLKGEKLVKIKIKHMKMPNDNLRDNNSMLSSYSSIVIVLNCSTRRHEKTISRFFSYQMINCPFS